MNDHNIPNDELAQELISTPLRMECIKVTGEGKNKCILDNDRFLTISYYEKYQCWVLSIYSFYILGYNYLFKLDDESDVDLYLTDSKAFKMKYFNEMFGAKDNMHTERYIGDDAHRHYDATMYYYDYYPLVDNNLHYEEIYAGGHIFLKTQWKHKTVYIPPVCYSTDENGKRTHYLRPMCEEIYSSDGELIAFSLTEEYQHKLGLI